MYAARARVSPTPWGVYVHVPWCRIRCPYCAFHVDVARDIPSERFVDRVIALYEARRPIFGGSPRTVYIGGGTPTQLHGHQLIRLVRALRTPTTVEVTLEANPEDVSPESVQAWVAAGVDRVSLGVQTLSAPHARSLGRAHTPEHAVRAAAILRASSLRTWSADLMFNLHDQDLDALAQDVDAMLALGSPHVSIYGLTIEPGTPYERGVARGAITPGDDETWRAMYGHIHKTLSAAGLHRYEVSNFARDGHQSEHNRGYWQARPYLGVGPSAHGFAPDGSRWVDVANTEAWLHDDDPIGSREHPKGLSAAIDHLIAGMRGVQGVALDTLVRCSGFAPTPAGIAGLIARGVLVEAQGRMKLTDEGFYVADAVVAALVDALEPVDPVRATR